MKAKPVTETVARTMARHAMAAAGDTIVVAVSGGADSLCLMHVLWTLAPGAGWRLHVAHLDHGLRGEESARDALLVAESAARLGLPATVERRDVAAHRQARRLTMEEAAREVRYAFLAEVARRVGAAAVATGHTADDSVESIVLHWLRGAGLAGLRGIQPARPLAPGTAGQPVRLIRPLLDLNRADTESYCRETGLDFVVDATNADERLPRNRIRRRLLPDLETYNPNLRRTLLRAAAVAADHHDFMAVQVAERWALVMSDDSGGALAVDRRRFTDQHSAMQSGLLREALTRLWGGWQDFGWVHVDGMRAAIATGRVGTVVDLPHGLALAVGYESAWVGPQEGVRQAVDRGDDLPAAPASPLRLAAPGVTTLPGSPWSLVVELDSGTGDLCELLSVCVDADEVGGELWLRGPRPGDRLQPLGMTGTKKLQDLLVDAKVPRAKRTELPLVECGRGLVWVAGRPGLPALTYPRSGQAARAGWLAHWARVRPETGRAWRLRFTRVRMDG
jgi:tRNA(Ile)-lysidine synthetase-like protein